MKDMIFKSSNGRGESAALGYFLFSIFLGK